MPEPQTEAGKALLEFAEWRLPNGQTAIARGVVALQIPAIEQEARAATLAEVEAAVKGLTDVVPMYKSGGEDYMCPNCVTPWKCNGPHIPMKRGKPDYEYVDRAEVLRAIAALRRSGGAG